MQCRESIRLSSSFKAVFINEKAFPSRRLFNSKKIPQSLCSNVNIKDISLAFAFFPAACLENFLSCLPELWI